MRSNAPFPARSRAIAAPAPSWVLLAAFWLAILALVGARVALAPAEPRAIAAGIEAARS